MPNVEYDTELTAFRVAVYPSGIKSRALNQGAAASIEASCHMFFLPWASV